MTPPEAGVITAAIRVLRPYIPVFLFVLVAAGFAIFTILFSKLLHPSKPNPVKAEPYECGIAPIGDV